MININKCPNCGSTQFQTSEAQPPHGQKLICGNCNRFIKWLPKQKNLAQHQNLKSRLEALKDKVGGWDSAFVNDLIKNLRIAERDGKIFKLSPRQSECLQNIEGKFSSINPQSLDINGGAR